jgi:hypothetical protein
VHNLVWNLDRKLLLGALLLAACTPASAGKTDPVPPAPTTHHPRSPTAEADDGAAKVPTGESDPSLVEAVQTDGRALDDVVRDFLRAANGDDDAAAQALSTEQCWQNECAGFARQAGAKFEARAGKVREQQDRAVAHADVICPGERKCDEVELLLQRTSNWQVADITENESKAEAWLSGAATNAGPTRRELTPEEKRDNCGFKGRLICCLGAHHNPGDKVHCYPQ